MSDTVNQTEMKKKPDLYIHAKVPHGNSTKIGSRIGVAWQHGEGQGYNIILDAQPIPNGNGQIELVAFPPKDYE